MNILLVPVGSHGDVHPFCGIGAELRRRGHAVTVFTNAHFEPLVRRVGLDFVPVAREPYDLVMAADTVADPILAPLWALLDDPGFRAAVEQLGGYSTSETGRRIR